MTHFSKRNVPIRCPYKIAGFCSSLLLAVCAHATPFAPQPRPADTDTPAHHKQLTVAYQAYQHHELKTAQQHYLSLYQQYPENTDILLALAAIARQHQEYQSAQHYLQLIVQTHPAHPRANAMLASLTLTRPEQEGHLKSLLARQHHPALLFALGNLLAEDQRWHQAQQYYFQALRLQPAHPLYQYNLAVSLDQLGKTRQALSYYQQAADTQTRAVFPSATRTAIKQRIKELEYESGH